MKNAVLGLSAYYHDSAAAVLVDGEIIAAAQEERFTRKKHDPSFPVNAARYVLQEAGILYSDLTAVSFYDKPFLKFERLLETYHGFAPRGLISFLSSMPVWIQEKLFMKKALNGELGKLGEANVPLFFPEHHLSHAASAFFPSPFSDAAIVTIDGVGEWATTAIGRGDGNTITILRELDFPHSIGLFYSAFTYYTGFRVNSGEYKLMGLAPYGDPDAAQTRQFIEKIRSELIDIRKDGSIILNMKYFDFATGLKMVNDSRWERLFGIPARKGETEISRDYMNMALAVQQVTEDIVLKIAATAKEITGSSNIVLAGGVALNCVANGRLVQSNLFKNIWIQPAAGDAGGAIGAAYAVWHIHQGNARNAPQIPDAMHGSYLGPEFSNKEIARCAKKLGAPYRCFDAFDQLADTVAQKLNEGNVVGWFQGRMEFGPRALGNRSILGDARNPEMQKKMNLKIKYREGFRPFAPSVLDVVKQDYFELDVSSPYMALVVPVIKHLRRSLPDNYNSLSLYDRLYWPRSDFPAATHIDFSARVQTVHADTNPRFHRLIEAFRKQTGCGLIVNTSFNVRGEPMVCTPEDAYRCFMRTEMDFLALGDYLFDKKEQPAPAQDRDWKQEFALD